MNRRNKQSHAAAYMRGGSIQQLFGSNADMARHLFKELLNDGQEHSAKEINNYIYEKTGGWGVDGERLTDETIHSAIWYMFRHDHDLSYMQTRKGFYQKNSAENLLGSDKNSLRGIAIKVLSDAKKTIQQYLAVPGLSEQEQRKLIPIRKAILEEVSNAIYAIGADNLGQEVITAENLEIDNDDGLMIEKDHINAYIGAYFNAVKRFNLKIESKDDYLSLYADFYPTDGRLDVYYIHHGSDGGEIATKPVDDLTDDEKEAILQLMKDAGLDDLVAEMNGDQDFGISLQ
ncbi:MAG TPA: hypothetical protein DEB10_09140 [Ruminococcaceae bacterium]|nr:hypothetical protein [Oscillospiraceae bacterium]